MSVNLSILTPLSTFGRNQPDFDVDQPAGLGLQARFRKGHDKALACNTAGIVAARDPRFVAGGPSHQIAPVLRSKMAGCIKIGQ